MRFVAAVGIVAPEPPVLVIGPLGQILRRPPRQRAFADDGAQVVGEVVEPRAELALRERADVVAHERAVEKSDDVGRVGRGE